MTAVIENTVDIDRTPADVFDYLSDMSNEMEWNPDCISVERMTEGPLGVGTTFRAKWKQGPHITSECVEFERPRQWTYVNAGPMSVRLTVRLEPIDGSATRMTARGEWTGRGRYRIVFPIFVRIMRRAERRTVAHAKQALESRRDLAGRGAGEAAGQRQPSSGVT